MTTIKLSLELHKQLISAAKKLRRSKDWIIVHALQEYIKKFESIDLDEEARRQSLLASKKKQNNKWEKESDLSDWE